MFGRRKKREQNKAEEQKKSAEQEAPPTRSAGLTGPFDVADAPADDTRIDFGGLQIPAREGLQISVEADEAQRRMTGLSLLYKETSVQLNAFAAPRSESIWLGIRDRLRESITAQGATAELRDGSFGKELHARIPVNDPNSRTRSFRPMRFVGVEGPRWVLRAVISGAAMQNPALTAEVEEIIRSVVVVRGEGAMAPTEVIQLRMPGASTTAQQGNPYADIDGISRGPEIAEIR